MGEVLQVSSRLIVRKNNKVLMSQGDIGSIKFLGGRMKLGEVPEETAIREGREEAGITLLRPDHLYMLPYQNNDPERPSFWFGANMPNLTIDSLVAGDDVLALFLVDIVDVEARLTYPNWKEHWVKKLLPNLK